MVCHAQSATSVRPRRSIPHRPPIPDLIIEHAIGLFLDGLVSQGVRDTTLVTKGNRLRRLFAPVLAEPLRSLSAERLQRLTATLAASRNKHTGAALTPATLTSCRQAAQRFTRWCVSQNRLPSDPMAVAKNKTLAQLHSELNQLRAAVFATGQERQALAVATRPRPTAVPPKSADLTIAAALALYLDSLTTRGRRSATIRTQKRQLRRFFGPALGQPLHTLSTERLQDLARSLAAVRSKKTGAPLASETLCFCREVARSFARWCTSQGRLSTDPARNLSDSFTWLSDEAKQLRAYLDARQAPQSLHIREGAQ